MRHPIQQQHSCKGVPAPDSFHTFKSLLGSATCCNRRLDHFSLCQRVDKKSWHSENPLCSLYSFEILCSQVTISIPKIPKVIGCISIACPQSNTQTVRSRLVTLVIRGYWEKQLQCRATASANGFTQMQKLFTQFHSKDLMSLRIHTTDRFWKKLKCLSGFVGAPCLGFVPWTLCSY